MSQDLKLHFGGLWAVVDEPADSRRLRSALHFFGENYLVFLDFEKPNKVVQAIYHYVLDDGEMWMQLLDAENKEEQPIIEVQWRLIDDRLLEFSEAGKMSVWEPLHAEELVAEGYPIQLFESLRRSFVDAGSFYSTEPLAPHPSAFAALRTGSRGKPKMPR